MTTVTSSPTDVLGSIEIIDADTHVIEPPDLWTSRISTTRWGDLVPHVRFDEGSGEDWWFFTAERVTGVASLAMAFWPEHPPLHPKRLKDADPSAWDIGERLRLMDAYGIRAQVLYPNVAGFGTGRFMQIQHRELMGDCVRAYNDYLVDYGGADRHRFVPIAALPFWSIEESVFEMERAADLGHRGVLFGNRPEDWGMPELTDRRWDPIWAAAQDLDLPVNFHIAAGDNAEAAGNPENGPHANYASYGPGFSMANAWTIAKLTCGGICHRFPKLQFVSVESGVGWIPFALASLDWQWKNCGVAKEHPEYDLLPSEYFQRQMYGCFWFEEETAMQAIEVLGADRLLFETDFPHPTSMTPGPTSAAREPREHVASALAGLGEAALRKVLHDNAAKLYRLDSI